MERKYSILFINVYGTLTTNRITFYVTIISSFSCLFIFNEIVVILINLLLLTFVIANLAILWVYMQPPFLKISVFTGFKISLILGLATSTVAITAKRSEVIVRLRQLLHICANDPSFIPTLPLPLSLLSVTVGLANLTSIATFFHTTLISGN